MGMDITEQAMLEQAAVSLIVSVETEGVKIKDNLLFCPLFCGIISA